MSIAGQELPTAIWCDQKEKNSTLDGIMSDAKKRRDLLIFELIKESK